MQMPPMFRVVLPEGPGNGAQKIVVPRCVSWMGSHLRLKALFGGLQIRLRRIVSSIFTLFRAKRQFTSGSLISSI